MILFKRRVESVETRPTSMWDAVVSTHINVNSNKNTFPTLAIFSISFAIATTLECRGRKPISPHLNGRTNNVPETLTSNELKFQIRALPNDFFIAGLVTLNSNIHSSSQSVRTVRVKFHSCVTSLNRSGTIALQIVLEAYIDSVASPVPALL